VLPASGRGQKISTDGGASSRPSLACPALLAGDRQRLCAFLARLARMSEEERITASRYSFTRWERHVWAARYPEEVPLINGEVEWIALRLPDLE
jgi:hypothetical protein